MQIKIVPYCLWQSEWTTLVQFFYPRILRHLTTRNMSIFEVSLLRSTAKTVLWRLFLSDRRIMTRTSWRKILVVYCMKNMLINLLEQKLHELLRRWYGAIGSWWVHMCDSSMWIHIWVRLPLSRWKSTAMWYILVHKSWRDRVTIG